MTSGWLLWAGRVRGGVKGGVLRGRVLIVIARAALVWVLAGVAAGVAWRCLTPVVSGWSQKAERDVSGDMAFAMLAVVAGLVAAVVGMVRSGPGAVARFLAAVAGTTAASLVAWGVGRLLGAPTLTVIVVLMLWPLALGAATVLGSLVAVLWSVP